LQQDFLGLCLWQGLAIAGETNGESKAQTQNRQQKETRQVEGTP